MPEGPEIRRTADRLAAAVAGGRLERVWFAFPELRQYEQGLHGRVLEAVEPRGKALLLHFDNGWTLYTHNQLYGRWLVAKAGERPASRRSLRVALETSKRAILLYSASDVAMWRTDALEAHPFLARIGPDVLDPGLTPEAVTQRLISPRFARRRLAGLLLDQDFLAGMGNYLRSEVLFAAGLDAARTPASLGAAQRERLAGALLDIPRHSYRTRGIEPAAGMRADYLERGKGAFRFRVFDREGQPCPECGTAIVRNTASGRRLYSCPRCQPAASAEPRPGAE